MGIKTAALQRLPSYHSFSKLVGGRAQTLYSPTGQTDMHYKKRQVNHGSIFPGDLTTGRCPAASTQETVSDDSAELKQK